MARKEPEPHAWMKIALGRICSRCKLVQANGEFDDSVPCTKTDAE